MADGDRSRKPKNLYIAHRRSPSELTSLMVEQYNLQRQLEAVQLQQKQILLQQLGHDQGFKSHSRTLSVNNNSHRRTGSLGGAPQGHSRRHSLGVNEAIKAAASQKQSNLASLGGSTATTSPPGLQAQAPSSLGGVNGNPDSIGGYRFPNTPSDSDKELSPSHAHSRSLAYGQQFKFPPDNSSFLPPVPTFSSTSPERGHQRRGSHLRSNSRNYDSTSINSNWRSQQQPAGQQYTSTNLEPPQPFVPGHRNKSSSYGGGSSISSFSQLNGPGNNSNGRKSLFAPYLPQMSLPELINDGRLVTGTLRVNKKNRSDAYVSTDGLLEADIFICGSKDRNRALEGDLVAVELLVVDEVWESKKEKEEKKRRKDNNMSKSPMSSVLNDDIHNDATSTLTADSKSEMDGEGLNRRGSLKQRPTMKKNDDVEVEGQALLLVEEEEINDEVKPLYAGHVVAVVDRIPGQIFAGTLGLLRPAQAAQAAMDKKHGRESSVQTPRTPKIVWFKPTDKRVPLIAIPTEQAPRDFVDNHERYADLLFIASIKRWPITSLHPFGTIVCKLGKIDDPAIEVDALLRDNNFACDEYPDEEEGDEGYAASFYGSIPSIEAELSNPARVEYLNDYIISFTENKEFVDHAFHVKRLSNTKIEFGFHSADISHFVNPGSSLERKAKKRSCSVFLPQKTSHLYPERFNEVVSFKENSKNLALSVIFEIDTTGFEVEDIHIQETVIVPKSLVTYDEVDNILNNQPAGDITSATSDYIKTFALIAKEFRRQRLENRGLGINPNLTLLNQLDDEKVRLHLNIYQASDALLAISEIYHKVNATVAAKIHAYLGDEAFLRRHALPTVQKLEGFSRKAANLGFQIDTTSSVTLQNSILKIEDPVKRQCMETLLFKSMPKPKYFIAGKQDPDSYGHHYLNLPLHTHFTSPLRRFADLIVHRQVKAVITKTTSEPNNIESLKTIADYCNFKKDCSGNAQEQAIHLLLSQTINEMSESTGQLLVMGMVVQVYESSFDVFIPELGIEKRVHGDQLPLVKAEYDKAKRILELYWEKGVDAATYVPPDEKTSLSYRSSIKNKYRTSALEAAKFQDENMKQGNSITPSSIADKLAKLNIDAPQVGTPTHDSGDEGLQPYLRDVVMRTEGNSCIQEIREMRQIPVLLRAEIGMALPCLTVRVLNPFAE